MPSRFYLKRRDTRPVLEVELLDPDGSTHDLTGATGVTLHVHLRSGAELSRAMVMDPDPTTGIARYTWLATDWTDTVPLEEGTHRMEYEVVGPGTARLTWPNDGFDELRVADDIGQAT